MDVGDADADEDEDVDVTVAERARCMSSLLEGPAVSWAST